MNTLFLPCEAGYAQVSQDWWLTRDADPVALRLFQRHYSCSNLNPKNGQFVAPGEKMILLGGDAKALFVWNKQLFRQDGQQGINCSVFRNEGYIRSSELIRQACEIALCRWPGERMFTFVNPVAVRSVNPGYCFKSADWKRCGVSQAGLLIFEFHSLRGA